MSASLAAFLAGLVGVPVALLWWGHRLRRLEPRKRRMFWGAVTGHCLAGMVTVAAGLASTQAWTAGDTLRGFAGLWSMLLLPILGCAAGAMVRSKRR